MYHLLTEVCFVLFVDKHTKHGTTSSLTHTRHTDSLATVHGDMVKTLTGLTPVWLVHFTACVTSYCGNKFGVTQTPGPCERTACTCELWGKTKFGLYYL